MGVPTLASPQNSHQFSNPLPTPGPSSNGVGGVRGAEDALGRHWPDPEQGQPALGPTPEGESPSAESDPAREPRTMPPPGEIRHWAVMGGGGPRLPADPQPWSPQLRISYG